MIHDPSRKWYMTILSNGLNFGSTRPNGHRPSARRISDRVSPPLRLLVSLSTRLRISRKNRPRRAMITCQTFANRQSETSPPSCAGSWPRYRVARSSASGCTRFSSPPDRRFPTSPSRCSTACSPISKGGKQKKMVSMTSGRHARKVGWPRFSGVSAISKRTRGRVS